MLGVGSSMFDFQDFSHLQGRSRVPLARVLPLGSVLTSWRMASVGVG